MLVKIASKRFLVGFVRLMLTFCLLNPLIVIASSGSDAKSPMNQDVLDPTDDSEDSDQPEQLECNLGSSLFVSIEEMADCITLSFRQIGALLVALSYLTGIGFAVSAIFKFKQHKDNPAQVSISTPISLLGISTVLVFIPMLFSASGKTIFGGKGVAGGFRGEGVVKLPKAE